MAKKQYVYKIIPVNEIYLSEYLDDVDNNGKMLDDSMRVGLAIDDSVEVFESITKIKDDKALKILILMLLGYKPQEMAEVMKMKKATEVYNVIQRLRVKFKDRNKSYKY